MFCPQQRALYAPVVRARATPLVLLFAFAAACSSGSSNVTPTPSASPPSTPSSIATPTPGSGPFAVVTEADFHFTPSTFAIGTSQGLSIKNSGPSLHNFSIPGTQVDIDVQPGQSSNTEAIGGVVKAGTYQFFCKYHKSRGMVGTITVVSSS
jgi:plastocyanin